MTQTLEARVKDHLKFDSLKDAYNSYLENLKRDSIFITEEYLVKNLYKLEELFKGSLQRAVSYIEDKMVLDVSSAMRITSENIREVLEYNARYEEKIKGLTHILGIESKSIADSNNIMKNYQTATSDLRKNRVEAIKHLAGLYGVNIDEARERLYTLEPELAPKEVSKPVELYEKVAVKAEKVITKAAKAYEKEVEKPVVDAAATVYNKKVLDKIYGSSLERLYLRFENAVLNTAESTNLYISESVSRVGGIFKGASSLAKKGFSFAKKSLIPPQMNYNLVKATR